SRPNNAWRIFHRTTFVSRVPAESGGESAGEQGGESARGEAESANSVAENVDVPGARQSPDGISTTRNDLLIRLLVGDVPEGLTAAYPSLRSGGTLADVDCNVSLLVNSLPIPNAEKIPLAQRIQAYMAAYLAPPR